MFFRTAYALVLYCAYVSAVDPLYSLILHYPDMHKHNLTRESIACAYHVATMYSCLRWGTKKIDDVSFVFGKGKPDIYETYFQKKKISSAKEWTTVTRLCSHFEKNDPGFVGRIKKTVFNKLAVAGSLTKKQSFGVPFFPDKYSVYISFGKKIGNTMRHSMPVYNQFDTACKSMPYETSYMCHEDSFSGIKRLSQNKQVSITIFEPYRFQNLKPEQFKGLKNTHVTIFKSMSKKERESFKSAIEGYKHADRSAKVLECMAAIGTTLCVIGLYFYMLTHCDPSFDDLDACDTRRADLGDKAPGVYLSGMAMLIVTGLIAKVFLALSGNNTFSCSSDCVYDDSDDGPELMRYWLD